MSRISAALLAMLLFAFTTAATVAQEKAEPKVDDSTKTADAPTAASIAQWVKDLDHDDFAVRQRATMQLIAAGQAAIGPVAKAAEGESLEVTTRCLDVLTRLHGGKDAATKTAAESALEGLSKSKNASAARRAEEILRPEKPAEPAAPPAALGGRVIIGGFGVAGPGMKVSVRTEGGNKTIDAEEGGKKIKIEEKAGAIKVQVTETVDGKEKTSTYEAKNADELRKNHAEAAKLYEKYSKFGGAAVLRIGGVAGGLGGGRAMRVGVIPQKALDQLEEARKQLHESTEQLKKLAGESRIDPERVKKLAEQIDEAKKKLEEAQKQLGK